MKKVLCLLISIITVITMLSGVQAVFAESQLVLGQIAKVSLEHDGKTQTYVYTPKKSGKYVLSSHAKEGIDPKCTVLVYSSGDPVAVIEDTEGYGNNFREVIELKEGTQYLFVFGMNKKNDAAEYDVDLFEYVEPSPEPDPDPEPQPEPPQKVTGLISAGRGENGTRIRLGWDAQENATGYIVYQKIDGEFTKIGETQSNDFNVTGLNPSWEYYFKVAAVNGDAIGEMSDELHTVSACAAVQDFTAQAVNENTIQLNWTKGVCHGYFIQWSTDPTFKTGVQYKNVAYSQLDSYIINVNGNAQDYYVRIRAWRNWDGGYVYGDFTEATAVMAKVTGLISAGRGENGTRIRLSWDAQKNAESYNVYQIIDGDYKLIGNTQSNDFNVTGLNPSWAYYFRVAAVKNGRECEPSDDLYTVSACAAVEDFTVTAKDANTIQLNWTKGVCHGYFIQWSTDPTFSKDVHYSNVAYSQLDSYTINVNSNSQKYYVRIRAWRNWDGGYVYGDFTQAVKAEVKA